MPGVEVCVMVVAFARKRTQIKNLNYIPALWSHAKFSPNIMMVIFNVGIRVKLMS